jgi:hypothetical protein
VQAHQIAVREAKGDCKRIRRVKLFGGGGLNRLILDALRRGGQPMTNVAIAAAIVEEKGYGEEAMPADRNARSQKF